jgi:hypothetical protein
VVSVLYIVVLRCNECVVQFGIRKGPTDSRSIDNPSHTFAVCHGVAGDIAEPMRQ